MWVYKKNKITNHIPAGVAQSVERVALMKRQPQGRGFEVNHAQFRIIMVYISDDMFSPTFGYSYQTRGVIRLDFFAIWSY